MALIFDIRVWLVIIITVAIEVGVGLAKYYVGRGGTKMVYKQLHLKGKVNV